MLVHPAKGAFFIQTALTGVLHTWQSGSSWVTDRYRSTKNLCTISFKVSLK
jgi:hypothetical protein